jgi:hypothetical protein
MVSKPPKLNDFQNQTTQYFARLTKKLKDDKKIIDNAKPTKPTQQNAKHYDAYKSDLNKYWDSINTESVGKAFKSVNDSIHETVKKVDLGPAKEYASNITQ